ncbi:hypothetical protein AX777_01250 [Sphingobium yanoikuyae]|uniref:Baseplate assembly protein n=1 Tax=Sphingobium yanoikuyae TaxID=13690 RepID=A0A177JZA8_SPHYA|nr:hypothetical protein [Sphingobium yanoikuyae]OAH46522.1 hypothetical protein AX777_01250 [Sphingobium yanoikuyae]RSU66474.1 hypothetical protein BRX37_25790 [Sphingomonas sp. S-NIH.Pt3_0716]
MIPLATNLDDADFDRLMATARGRLPALAPEWTDYNFHDPGIMLIELLAWLVDTQIYSVARDRLDERLAMTRLLGAPPRAAVPASGVVYPVEAPTAAQAIDAGMVLLPRTGSVQRVETTQAITLLPHAIARIATVATDGRATDQTQINDRARAGFSPFGDANDGTLRISLTGPLLPADTTIRLSLGFEVEGAPSFQPTLDLGTLSVTDAAGAPIAVALDGTAGFQRSGALILSLPAGAVPSAIILRPSQHYVLTPRLIRVALNALPVEQRATIALPVRDGNNRPGQTIEIDPSTLFPADEHGDGPIWRLIDAPVVESLDTVPGAAWNNGPLDPAGPADLRFAYEERTDGALIRIRFGNGVNGRKPALGEPLGVTLRLTCGDGGMARQPVDWVLDGARTLWRNREAIGGGADAQTVEDALAGIRAMLDDGRLLATSAQLAEAALTLGPALGVARATVEEGWQRGRTSPAIAATRTLIVGHRLPGRETPDWLARIAAALRPRIAIGERLLVVAPVYRSFTFTIAAGLAPGQDGAAVKAAVAQMIADRFALDDARWPLGHDVEAAAIAGWVRRIAGVAAPVMVRIITDDGPVERLAIGRGELPQLGAPAAISIGGAA